MHPAGRISPPSSRMPSQLEGAMDALITVFYNYSGNDGDKYKLNKGELKQLLNSELTDFLTVKDDIPFEISQSVRVFFFFFWLRMQIPQSEQNLQT